MSSDISPLFETDEEAASYDRWYRAKVQAALDDPRPGIPHDEAMVLLDRMIEERRKNRRATV
ncbi:stability determinant [Pseudomonas sp. NPDC088429]|uniref:type II toxin-antitoxin system RelB family antitoxin n=1 Tax=Pseudomonas sp. NPDC088429 TaxID=3364455 RepID=UPI003809A533